MQPSELRAWLVRLGLNPHRLAGRLGRQDSTVRKWLATDLPPETALWLSELVRREWVRRGLGTASCAWCGGLAVEDSTRQDDRYTCVACGRGVEVSTRATGRAGHERAQPG